MARSPATRNLELPVFKVRCEARALLCYAAELTLHEAVDELQHAAKNNGLVRKTSSASWKDDRHAKARRVRRSRAGLRSGLRGRRSEEVARTDRQWLRPDRDRQGPRQADRKAG